MFLPIIIIISDNENKKENISLNCQCYEKVKQIKLFLISV